MLKLTQFCSSFSKFFKTAAQAVEVGDFLDIFLKLFEAQFLIKTFAKKTCISFYAVSTTVHLHSSKST